MTSTACLSKTTAKHYVQKGKNHLRARLHLHRHQRPWAFSAHGYHISYANKASEAPPSEENPLTITRSTEDAQVYTPGLCLDPRLGCHLVSPLKEVEQMHQDVAETRTFLEVTA